MVCLRQQPIGVKVNELRAIALSHGHADHHGGLAGLVNRVGQRGLPLVLHPDAWLDRKLVFPDGRWSVGEKQLPDPPSQGDVVDFDGYGDWRIEGQQRVGVRPAGKAPREFFVCAPAA